MLFKPLKPMLLSSSSQAFDDANYIFEPKWDGWRIQIHKKDTRIEAYTRPGNCVTSKFPELVDAAAAFMLRAQSWIVKVLIEAT
jgi:bifunctional non-homologous end joining protein LigD